MIFFGILGHLANIDSQIHAFSIPSTLETSHMDSSILPYNFWVVSSLVVS